MQLTEKDKDVMAGIVLGLLEATTYADDALVISKVGWGDPGTAHGIARSRREAVLNKIRDGLNTATRGILALIGGCNEEDMAVALSEVMVAQAVNKLDEPWARGLIDRCYANRDVVTDLGELAEG